MAPRGPAAGVAPRLPPRRHHPLEPAHPHLRPAGAQALLPSREGREGRPPAALRGGRPVRPARGGPLQRPQLHAPRLGGGRLRRRALRQALRGRSVATARPVRGRLSATAFSEAAHRGDRARRRPAHRARSRLGNRARRQRLRARGRLRPRRPLRPGRRPLDVPACAAAPRLAPGAHERDDREDGEPPGRRAAARRWLGWRLQPAGWGGWSPTALWHTGFTGTSLLLSPEQGIGVALAANGVHPHRRPEEQDAFRARIPHARRRRLPRPALVRLCPPSPACQARGEPAQPPTTTKRAATPIRRSGSG